MNIFKILAEAVDLIGKLANPSPTPYQDKVRQLIEDQAKREEEGDVEE